MGKLQIIISEPKAVQALTIFTEDIQNVLVEKAVADFFENKGHLDIIAFLNECGIMSNGKSRGTSRKVFWKEK